MEPGVMEPGGSDGTEPAGMEPGSTDGTDPAGMEPGPYDGTDPAGMEPGPYDGTEPGQSDGMEPGQINTSLEDELEPVQRCELKQEQTNADQMEETESRQMDGSQEDTGAGVTMPLSSSSSDQDLAMTGASEQEGQEGHVPSEAMKVEPGGTAGLQEDPISMAVAIPLPSSSDEDLTVNEFSEQEGKEDGVATSEPSVQELGEHPAEKQREENVSITPTPGPTPCADKESPPPRPPTLPSSTSRERGFIANEIQLVPPKSESPEKGRLPPLHPRPPRPPRPQMPMRQRTNSLPHRPVSGLGSEVRGSQLGLWL